jgi:hypothetical protein
MYKEVVTVYGEDFLEPKAINAASVTGSSVLNADGTMGALTANVIAVDDVNVASAMTVVIKASDEKAGTYAEVAKGTVATGTYVAGDVMGTVAIPFDVKKYVKAELTSATGNSGTVRVTGGYLPR